MLVDYRFDPFSNTKQPVEITNERWTIPSSSPFVIRLWEVPLKETPSSLKIRVVDSLTAAITTTTQTSITVAHGAWFAVNNVITIDSEKMLVTNINGNTLTVTRGYSGTTATTHTSGTDVFIEDSMAEVAAQPAAGQFWPDYSTGADNDPNWNTGTILFNSADAGKQVVVSYKGMGSLADTRVVNHGKVIYTTPGTYTFTVPDGVTEVYVTMCGGGGGGGRGAYGVDPAWVSGGGGGGGGAAVFKQRVTGLTPGQQITVTVGAGGNGGSGSGPQNGAAGGASSFGTYISCSGGGGGTRASSGLVHGGAAGGSLATKGGPGLASEETSVSGAGGSSLFSGGAPSVCSSSGAISGIDAGGYGGGGSGGIGGGNGGKGSSGFVLVEW